jgi:ketosteroid isomerase-like protein
MSSLEEFCDAWLASWTGNDPERLLAFYADDAAYRDPGSPKGLHGHAALRPYFGKLLAANPDWRWTREELIPTTAGFTLKWRAQIPVGGTVIEEVGLDIVEMADGRITRNEVYFDRTALLQVLRNPPVPG